MYRMVPARVAMYPLTQSPAQHHHQTSRPIPLRPPPRRRPARRQPPAWHTLRGLGADVDTPGAVKIMAGVLALGLVYHLLT